MFFFWCFSNFSDRCVLVPISNSVKSVFYLIYIIIWGMLSSLLYLVFPSWSTLYFSIYPSFFKSAIRPYVILNKMSLIFWFKLIPTYWIFCHCYEWGLFHCIFYLWLLSLRPVVVSNGFLSCNFAEVVTLNNDLVFFFFILNFFVGFVVLIFVFWPCHTACG